MMNKPKVCLCFACSLLAFLQLFGLINDLTNYQDMDFRHNQMSDHSWKYNAERAGFPEEEKRHSVISNQYLNYWRNSSHQKSAIQMSENQIDSISKVLPLNGNLLVWGLGNDSPYWHNSTNGKVTFIEDDSPAKKAGIQWYSKIMQKYPYLESYRVHYKTNTVKSFSKYVNNPETWHELDLCSQLPDSVTQTHWHVIIVDAPLGCGKSGPGRYQSIYTSWKLAKINTHIFIDDFERKVEHEISVNIFGKPVEVNNRSNTKFSKANEQAHFIINSRNVFKPNTTRSNEEHGIESNTNMHKWSLLLTVNNGFFDMFNNWLLHYMKLNISLPVYIIAEDNIVYNKLTALKGMTVKRSESISIKKTVNYGSHSYKKMVSARPTYIFPYLKNGMNIIYCDIDTVWLRNPVPFLNGSFDIWSQMDGESKYEFCTGFLAVQSNKNTLEFIKKWQDRLKETPDVNQNVFNELLRTNKIDIKSLERKHFPSGKLFFDQFSDKDRAEVVVVHNNWIIGHDEKVRRFKKMKLWLNGSIN